MSREEQILHRGQDGPLEVILWREPEGFSLTIDDYWQFASHDEHVFHEVLVDPAMQMAPNVAQVLILGGGDGLVARNVLRYPGVQSVVLVDNDPQVTQMAREVPELVELNARSMLDPRVRVVHEDACAFVEGLASGGAADYGVVICDFPAPTHERYAKLFAAEFYAQLVGVCRPDAALAVQVSADPEGFWPVLDAVERSFPNIQPRLVELSEGEWATSVLASRGGLELRRSLAEGAVFLGAHAQEELVILNRAGDHFRTLAYGVRPEYG